MSIKDIYKHLRELLSNIQSDLEKSEKGNKAASQRVRTGTVKLEKIAKHFRKESIVFEKKNKGVKKPAKASSHAKKSAKPAAKHVAPKGKHSAPVAKAKAPAAKAKAPAAKAAPKK